MKTTNRLRTFPKPKEKSPEKDNQKPKKKGSKKPLIILGLVLVVGAIAGDALLPPRAKL